MSKISEESEQPSIRGSVTTKQPQLKSLNSAPSTQDYLSAKQKAPVHMPFGAVEEKNEEDNDEDESQQPGNRSSRQKSKRNSLNTPSEKQLDTSAGNERDDEDCASDDTPAKQPSDREATDEGEQSNKEV